MPDVSHLRINRDRLWQRLEAMSRFGATGAGGVNRQALTDEDRRGRECFLDWARAAGCTVRVDEIGNLFVRREGSDPSAPAVLTGSHLDTQPSGGNYDGIYGVLAGLEVIETLNDAHLQTRHPLEVVVWTNEEGCRFDTAMMGSAVWSGRMSLSDALALQDRKGTSVAEALAATGFEGSEPAQPQPVHAAFELHIEQGPVLEQEDKAIGVVQGVQHMSRHRLIVHGVEAHAGPTPMVGRKDPVQALAGMLPRLYALADEHAPEGRVTVGYIDTRPGSSNTVPGRVEFTVDLRHPDQSRYAAMVAALGTIASEVNKSLGLDYELSCFWEAPGVTFHPDCIAAVQAAVDMLGYSQRSIVSGAGHDACNVASVAPTSMIFIPCKDGLSHNEAESITQEQAGQGADVLLHAIINSAGVSA
ncbi:M20 family metallo-hydrolase [Parahaliea aestuarii]|uniref:M20 family metallo-hydrolase n=1 Tax=Parahaliea aestuarii TaxID=1852021 RepID=A0A5C8ZSY1_9GAMM|nr:M20 family metallo-hydrolase [Parahaliea aestuarii]TXS91566.1 M20 family metallo-hydrolase [Parahaliea aestuarii]